MYASQGGSGTNRQEHAVVGRSFCCWAKSPHRDGCRSSSGEDTYEVPENWKAGDPTDNPFPDIYRQKDKSFSDVETMTRNSPGSLS